MSCYQLVHLVGNTKKITSHNGFDIYVNDLQEYEVFSAEIKYEDVKTALLQLIKNLAQNCGWRAPERRHFNDQCLVIYWPVKQDSVEEVLVEIATVIDSDEFAPVVSTRKKVVVPHG